MAALLAVTFVPHAVAVVTYTGQGGTANAPVTGLFSSGLSSPIDSYHNHVDEPFYPLPTVSFGGSGAVAYTATNDVQQAGMATLVLSSTSTSTETIDGADLYLCLPAGQYGTLAVDGSLTQAQSGAFIIATGLTGFARGLGISGPGTGDLTLSGSIQSSVTKNGSFTTTLTKSFPGIIRSSCSQVS